MGVCKRFVHTVFTKGVQVLFECSLEVRRMNLNYSDDSIRRYHKQDTVDNDTTSLVVVVELWIKLNRLNNVLNPAVLVTCSRYLLQEPMF
jgi:hypothetical protein